MADWRDEVWLEGEFYIIPNRRCLHRVTLLPGAIYYSKLSSEVSEYKEKMLRICDIIGARCFTPNSHNSLNPCRFTIFAYPIRTKVFISKQTRYRVTVTFEVFSNQFGEESKKVAYNWERAINYLARGSNINRGGFLNFDLAPVNPLIIFINPHSGPGKAIHLYRNIVKPMLKEASILFHVFVTEYAGHATSIVRQMDLSKWRGIVILSGDGLIYEVINGLMQRADWTVACKTPIGCLPAGSGNALSCSINYAAGESVRDNPVLHATFVLIKHRVIPMDLVRVQTPGRMFYSFLSITWGVVADVDLESEKYRHLGGARFTVGALKRILNRRTYKCRLSFLPVTDCISEQNAVRHLKGLQSCSLDAISSSAICNLTDSCVSSGLSSSSSAPNCNLSNVGLESHIMHSPDMLNEMETAVRKLNHSSNCWLNKSCCSLADANHHIGLSNYQASVAMYTSDSAGSFCNARKECTGPLPYSSVSACHESLIYNGNSTTVSSVVRRSKHTGSVGCVCSQGECVQETECGDNGGSGRLVTPHLPPVNQAVPDNWVVIDGEFVTVCAVYQTHLGSQCLMAPSAHIGDGKIHLLFVRDNMSRKQMLNFMLALADGSHLDLAGVEMVPVLAFRLEPVHGSDIFMVDGEQVKSQLLQAQVLPGLARVMAMR